MGYESYFLTKDLLLAANILEDLLLDDSFLNKLLKSKINESDIIELQDLLVKHSEDISED